MKEKWLKFTKKLPVRIYMLIGALLLFSFFSNDFGLVDVQKTAIILATGVDKTDEGVELTVQIAVPDPTQATSGGSSSVEVSGKGRTVSEGIAEIYAQTGWVPKFIFCDLLILSEEVASENVFGVLDFFLRDEYMTDTALLCICEGKAKDVLTSTSAIDQTSSFAVEKVFSDAVQKVGLTSAVTLKDFAIDYYGVGTSGYLPFLYKDEAITEPPGTESEGSGQKTYVFRADTVALFKDGVLVEKLTKDESLCMSLIQGKVVSGTLTVGAPAVSLSLITVDGGATLSDNEDKVTLSLDVTVRVHGTSTPSSVPSLTQSEADEKTLRSAEAFLINNLNSLFEKSKNSGADIFHLARTEYRYRLEKYRTSPERWKTCAYESTAKVTRLK